MVIPADDDAVWWRVAAVLRMEFGDAGFRWFDRWSRTSDKYDPAAVVRQWNAVANVIHPHGNARPIGATRRPGVAPHVTPAYERLSGKDGAAAMRTGALAAEAAS